ncbi:helix-turn-helix domain-containing protein [Fodinicola acaciae]|uniref:helix-turn-helix domain-containing protein n=1 Tax=Fodinicola acaciae TaxID=2681555 RepID=UPI0013D3309C|nr:helix-turn-helix transcriptional regulator [Fodinicola acaciae]
MPKVIGPTIPRWRLGEELEKFRKRAGKTFDDAMTALGCSESKVRKIEAGDVGMNRGELILLFDLYGIDDAAVREQLLELQKLGKQRSWWSQYGSVPAQFGTFLSFESAATAMRIYEPLMIHGLVQTESYARALTESIDVDPTPEHVDHQTRIRMARQERVLSGDEIPKVWTILDECALDRPVGGAEVMKEQLNHLADIAKQVNLQILPRSHGGHAGLYGAFTLFGFDENIHSPVVYVESQAGNLYLEKEADLQRCGAAYEQLQAAALSTRESVKLLRSLIEKMG